MSLPKQAANVHLETLDDELCVYDASRLKVHALNPTAALVWRCCDGHTTTEQMAERLRAELDAPHAEEIVWLTLDRLEKASLLEAGSYEPRSDPAAISRRQALGRLGLAAALLPVVVTIGAPSPAAAQSVNCLPPDEAELACDAAGGGIIVVGDPVGDCQLCFDRCLELCPGDPLEFTGIAGFLDGRCTCCCTGDNCEFSAWVDPVEVQRGGAITLHIHLEHNRPETVVVPFEAAIETLNGQVLARQDSDPIEFHPGDKRDIEFLFPIPEDIALGSYRMAIGIDQMQQGKIIVYRPFEVVA